MNALLRDDWKKPWREVIGYWTFFKNGNPKYWFEYPVTWLRECEQCGRWSTPKVVQYRSQARSRHPVWQHYGHYGATYCMACWNRIRPIDAALDEADEIDRLIRKIRRDSGPVRKAEREARAIGSGAVGAGDQERIERGPAGAAEQVGVAGNGAGGCEGSGAIERRDAD